VGCSKIRGPSLRGNYFQPQLAATTLIKKNKKKRKASEKDKKKIKIAKTKETSVIIML
jgi:hypothetical protein